MIIKIIEILNLTLLLIKFFPFTNINKKPHAAACGLTKVKYVAFHAAGCHFKGPIVLRPILSYSLLNINLVYTLIIAK